MKFVIKNILRYQDSKTNMLNICRVINSLGDVRKRMSELLGEKKSRSQGYATKMF